MRYNRFLGTILSEALSASEGKDKSDILLNDIFKAKRVGKRDRIWVSDRFFYYLRHKYFFDEVSENYEDLAKNISMMFEDEADEELAVKIGRLKTEGMFDALFDESFPPILISNINKLFNNHGVFGWLNSKAHLTLRTNLRRISREELMEKLAAEGFEGTPTRISPAGIIIDTTNKSLKNSPLFEAGYFEFQDESSQIASLLVSRECRTLLEPCSGGGGKSLAIASFCGGIRITASDSRTHLFKETEERAKRAGIRIKTAEFDSINENFDTVFIDAPCSGSGVLRRNPGDRWKIDEKLLAEVSVLQKELIRKFSAKVRKGGELIYVTCSFLPCENEEVISDFLNKNSDFGLIPAERRLAENLSRETDISEITENGFLRISPFSTRDLMFGAIMKRK